MNKSQARPKGNQVAAIKESNGVAFCAALQRTKLQARTEVSSNLQSVSLLYFIFNQLQSMGNLITEALKESRR